MSLGSEQRKLAAIVFTDMVGSTQLKRDLGDRQALALIQRHHALVRQVLGQFNDGEEISTAGDSFFLVFGNPSDAVRFALLLHAQLRALTQAAGRPIFDRIGIHVGEVFIEEGAGVGKTKDLHGIQVDTCSRLMSLAKANQILMTRFVFDNARQVLRGQDLAGVGPLAWMNHGPYLLKGLEEPLEICEVGEASVGPLTSPTNSEKARRHASAEDEPVLGWRPALEQVVPNTQWVLERKLGEGGFGEVWLGRHETLKERRVFKFCFCADRVRSLKREVTLFRLLKEKVGQHPNIVGIQEVFFEAPPFYIVMDYAEAMDLRAWCAAQGGVEKVPLATRLEIVAQVAEALAAAHVAGVIHRDVKPSNILVSEEGGARRPAEPACDQAAHRGRFALPIQVKLTDFGIGQVVTAEALAGLTRAGFTQTLLSPGSSTPAGTHVYMAPELLAGKPASIRSDIYSLGVVLYQLLVGDFSHPLTTDWAKRVSDPLLREDLEKCFAGEPEERFASAGELAKNLRMLERRQIELAVRERVLQRQKLFKKAGLAVSTFVVFCALLLAALKFMGQQKTKAPAVQKTIAVIHFRNDSPDPSDEYLSDSLTAEIIDGIRKVPGLNAVRPPAFLLTNSAVEMLQIFDQAHWPFKLEGSVQKTGGQIKITARLLRTSDGSELLSTNYDRAAGDLLGIPNDLALRIVEHSGVPLTAELRKRVEKTPTRSAEAYDYELRGRFHSQRLVNRADWEANKPLETLQRAVELDPNYAVAFADLSRAYVRQYFFFRPELGSQLEPKARAAFNRALKLDPELAEAHFAAGFYFWTPSQRWQFGKAIKEYLAALDKNPYWEEANDQLALIYIHAGLLEQGQDLAAKVLQNNPLNKGIDSLRANALFWQGRDAEAVDKWRKILAQSPGFIHRSYFAVALCNLDKTTEATDQIEDALKTDSQDTGGLYVSVQAILLAKQNNEAAATNKIASALESAKRFGHGHHAVYNVAAAYALLNKRAEAMKYLRDAAEDGFPCYPFFEVDVNLKNLRGDADFQTFMAQQKAQHERFKKEFGTVSLAPGRK